MLAGKAAAVFGYASHRSIAWGVASAWHAAGAAVTVGIQSERFRLSLERACASWSTPPHIVVCDVTRDADIDAAFSSIATAHHGRLHALAHCLAFAPATAMRAPLLSVTRDDFLLAHSASSYSLIALARAAAPLMVHHTAPPLANVGDDSSSSSSSSSGGGSIIALSYLGSTRAAQGYSVMGPAKASLEACARGLAAEMGPRGIRVNILSAGPIDTLAARGIPRFAELRQGAIERSPLQRGVTIDEVGAAALFLASSASGGVTGQTLQVDAGFSSVV